MATRTHNIKYPQVSKTSSEFFVQIEFDDFQRSQLKEFLYTFCVLFAFITNNLRVSNVYVIWERSFSTRYFLSCSVKNTEYNFDLIIKYSQMGKSGAERGAKPSPRQAATSQDFIFAAGKFWQISWLVTQPWRYKTSPSWISTDLPRIEETSHLKEVSIKDW